MNTTSIQKFVNQWKIAIGIVTACLAVFVFIYTYTVNIKNDEIALLERHVKLMEAQVRIFETELRLLKDRMNFNSYSLEKPAKEGAKEELIKYQKHHEEISLELHKDKIYQFPYDKNYSLIITQINKLKEIKVEFNLKEGIRNETLRINKTRLIHGDYRNYNILLKDIKKDNNDPVAVFSVVITDGT